MAVDEMERVEAEPRRDRRAGRERQHDAGQHQRERPRQASGGRPSTTNRRTGVRSRADEWRPCPAWSCRAMVSQAVTRSTCERFCDDGRRHPASPAPARGKHRRAPRNSDTGRTRRRPATAARPASCARTPRRRARRRRRRGLQRAGHLVRHFAVERAGEIVGRLADQIGLADAREEFCQRGDAAGLRLAAGDPEDIGEGRQRLRGGIGVGALESLTNSTLPLRPTCSMRCARPGKLRRPSAMRSRRRGRARARGRGARRRSAHCAGRAASRCRRGRAIASRLAAGGAHDARRPRHRCRRRSGASDRDRARRACRARAMRSAAARHQASSTPITAVPPPCTPATSRSLTAA